VHVAIGWLRASKRSGAEVVEQTGSVTSYSGGTVPLRNIIGQFHPERKERVLLFAHWDTRPFADKDDERTNEPIDGANDGGSGVGMLAWRSHVHLAAKGARARVSISSSPMWRIMGNPAVPWA
jgi:hypothetical protein